jgi:uncharacterized protein (TIGR01777 family)
MKILIPGGSGQIGTLLARHLHAAGHTVTVLSRTPSPAPWQTLPWDGLTVGPWVSEIHRSDAVIHLSGRSVNCRYTPANRRAIVDSRVLPTLLLGRVIAASPTPPPLWLNASTSTFYRNAFDLPQDEFTGEAGDLPSERGTHESADQPETWAFSIDVAQRWEAALTATPTPYTRKIRLRTSMTMSPDPGGVFRVLSRLTRLGLGGTQGSGKQFVSWIHELDFCRIVDLLLAHPHSANQLADETSGIINMTAPNPLPNRDFMRDLRRAWHMPIGLPAPAPLIELGTRILRTESELVLKSRRAVPTLLLNHGYNFSFPTWPEAATDLVTRTKSKA